MSLAGKIFWRLAPQRLLDQVNPPYAARSYSQEGEDRVLARLLEGQDHGYYVDVGAHHPQYFSNTYAFYLRGWRGINIDARPGSMQLFQKLRPEDVNLELAVSDEKKVLTYYEFNETPLNGFCKEAAMRAHGLGHFRIIGTREIEAVTLAEILEQHLPPSQTIDFLNVDVEGLDEQVLLSNDWDKFRPRLVLAEDTLARSYLEVSQSRVVALMVGYGYELFAKTMNTLIFRLQAE
jgi:FkbM family methyltransferase